MKKFDRREALRIMLGTSAMMALPSPLRAAAAGKPASKPNILVIMTDDQGAGDIGYVGNEWARTPVLDKLASESARFTNFVADPACTPSRASFLTGRNYNHTGVWGVGPRGYIRRDETFLPEYLRRGGYRTAHFGKWGEGWMPDQRTYMRGYDEAKALGGGYQHEDPWFDDNGTLVQKKGWTTDILADMTIDFIREQTKAQQPWYAITAYISPHSPWECPEEYSKPLRDEGYSEPLAAFYGMVRQMDAATGRILAELDKLGQAENTIVFFVSDNGATAFCERTGGMPLEGEDWARRNALHLRGHKAMAWENGIRVPCCVRWPGRIPAGKREQLGSYEDILPTLLDLAGVPDTVVSNHLPLHGISLTPVLFDPKAEDKQRYYFRIPVAFDGAPYAGRSMVISDPTELRYEQMHTVLYGPRFKYHSLPGGKQALYDMDVDPGETVDVAAEHPRVTAEMAQLCRAEWDKLIASGRGFWMPPILIGDPRYAGMKRCWAHLPPNIVPCNTAQQTSGMVSCPFEGLRGFAQAGDGATFALDVRATGAYSVSMKGQGLDACAPLVLDIDGRRLEAQSVAANKIDFGKIELAAKPMDLKIRAGVCKEAKPALIQEIAIMPTVE